MSKPEAVEGYFVQHFASLSLGREGDVPHRTTLLCGRCQRALRLSSAPDALACECPICGERGYVEAGAQAGAANVQLTSAVAADNGPQTVMP